MRIGYVDNTIALQQLAQLPREANTQAFVDALAKHGWAEKKNLEILWRSAEGNYQRRPGLFDELVRLKVDAIVVFGDIATREARERTRTIPIVMVTSVDPVGWQNADSLVRPGRNVTGLTLTVAGGATDAKRLQLLKQVAPGVTHVGWMHPGQPEAKSFSTELPRLAGEMGLKLSLVPFPAGIAEIERALAVAVGRGVNGLFFSVYSFFSDPRNSDAVRTQVERHRLPAVSDGSNTKLGAVLHYGADRRVLHTAAASYVDRILGGAKPAELPLEQPRVFRLVVNARAANAIGLTVPAGVLAQADEVIER